MIIPPWHCCGRTLISKGLLPQARKKAAILVDLLYPYASLGITICGLEPSCILTLRDEYRDFKLDKQKVDTIVQANKTIDEVLFSHIDLLKTILQPVQHPIFLHTHCHQKALLGSKITMSVLASIPQAEIYEIPSGCCGMAGSFGYEKEHYDLSQKIGELILFPAVRQLPQDAILISNGTSCKSQIYDSCHKLPLHLIELIAQLIQ